MMARQDTSTEFARQLMHEFAARTGLAPGQDAQVRYLWTDAFATCNFHWLGETSADSGLTALARHTVEQVHRHLGWHRADEGQQGWLHGPHGSASAEHPTRCGLRIGKPLPERQPGEPVDERLEWERDGQYFHYLTRWMHALDQLARATGDPQLNLWARELADTAHRAFTYTAPGGARRMVWKMSIDLSRPLVASMGHHDPLDGYITARALQATAAAMGTSADGPDLSAAVADYDAMITNGSWATTDPLGLGGLLMDAFRLEQLVRLYGLQERALLDLLLQSAVPGMGRAVPLARTPAEHRLGFRELGLSIGLSAVEHLARSQDRADFGGTANTRRLIELLMQHAGQRSAIEDFWRQPGNRNARSWTGHRDINEVMLATSLAPDGWLVLRPPS